MNALSFQGVLCGSWEDRLLMVSPSGIPLKDALSSTGSSISSNFDV